MANLLMGLVSAAVGYALACYRFARLRHRVEWLQRRNVALAHRLAQCGVDPWTTELLASSLDRPPVRLRLLRGGR